CHRVAVNHGAREVTLFERVAEAEAFRRVGEFLGEFVKYLVGHKDATCRDAPLSAGLEGTQDTRCHRKVESRVFANDDGTLAAHLRTDNTVIKLRRELLNPLADGVATSKEDNLHAGIAYQSLARRPPTMDKIDYAGRKAGFLEKLCNA